MPQNIEIKARLNDPQGLLLRIKELDAKGPETLLQKDTFFVCPNGRMKLRECQGKAPELIVYLRENTKEAKHSDYVRFPIADLEQTRKILTASHGVVGIVEKTRMFYFWNKTRIHVDDVKGLGNFIELEIEMEGLTDAEGLQIAQNLMARLGITKDDLLSNAYIDMLQAKG